MNILFENRNMKNTLTYFKYDECGFIFNFIDKSFNYLFKYINLLFYLDDNRTIGQN